MPPELPLPGTPQHQSHLATIRELYAGRDDVLALLLFGSLGRGGGDEYSDLDLAVVHRDDRPIDIPAEVEQVSAAFAKQGEQTLFVQVAGEDGYLVLHNLSAIAIAYHPLRSMSPYLLEGWRLLWGTLDEQTILDAAKANAHAGPSLSQQPHRALWLALSVDSALHRRQFWSALPALEPLRGALMEIFAGARGGKRAHRDFEEMAGPELKALFGLTFPRYVPASPAAGLRSIGDALLALLDLLEYHLPELSNHQLALGRGELEVIAQLRMRQQALQAQSGLSS